MVVFHGSMFLANETHSFVFYHHKLIFVERLSFHLQSFSSLKQQTHCFSVYDRTTFFFTWKICCFSLVWSPAGLRLSSLVSVTWIIGNWIIACYKQEENIQNKRQMGFSVVIVSNRNSAAPVQTGEEIILALHYNGFLMLWIWTGGSLGRQWEIMVLLAFYSWAEEFSSSR